jgi:hypothetical protein
MILDHWLRILNSLKNLLRKQKSPLSCTKCLRTWIGNPNLVIGDSYFDILEKSLEF